MSIRLAKINDIEVHPVNVGANIDPSKIKGGQLIPEVYANIFICAKKKSGKSQVINKLLRECVGRNTKIYFFVSTLYKDPLYKHILTWLDKKGIAHDDFTSLKEDGMDVLKEVIEQQLQQAEEEDDEDMPKPRQLIRTNEDEDEDEPKEKKEKKIAPEVLFIFDDLSRQLRSPTLAYLLKMHRHIKSKCIISSQYPNDLEPESLQQMDFVLLFKGHPAGKIEKLWADCDLATGLPLFKQLYAHATKNKYNFLFISTRDETFRKNFNKQYIVSEKEEENSVDEE